MTKWEYQVIRINRGTMDKKTLVNLVNGQEPESYPNALEFIQKLGEDGWELAALPSNVEYIFKRPKA